MRKVCFVAAILAAGVLDAHAECFETFNGKTPTQVHQLLGRPQFTSIDTVRGVDWVDETYSRGAEGVLIVGYIVKGGKLEVGDTCGPQR